MTVDNITPISFRSDAYDKLVMEEDQKAMILSLVATQLEKATRPDIIDGKGGGCIFLLAGEPGTGKTLTAEVTAEYLKRPLYMVGVGELGTSASELEKNLRQILDIAATWNAVTSSWKHVRIAISNVTLW
jgi:SpoVK/Ycf46/Vps4 family AAA+-type ATPase